MYLSINKNAIPNNKQLLTYYKHVQLLTRIPTIPCRNNYNRMPILEIDLQTSKCSLNLLSGSLTRLLNTSSQANFPKEHFLWCQRPEVEFLPGSVIKKPAYLTYLLVNIFSYVQFSMNSFNRWFK